MWRYREIEVQYYKYKNEYVLIWECEKQGKKEWLIYRSQYDYKKYGIRNEAQMITYRTYCKVKSYLDTIAIRL